MAAAADHQQQQLRQQLQQQKQQQQQHHHQQQHSGKVVLVTGCTRGGIGHALSAEFARRGCQVFATARKVASMGGLEALGCTLLPLDITDPASVAAAVRRVLKTAGRVDVLVNNAGLSGRGAVVEYALEEARKQFDVNVFGTLAMVQAVAPSMVERRSGTIINVGSALGLLTVPFAGAYCASKKALQSMTDALRMELAGSGVSVVYAAPGWVRSNIIDTMAASGSNCLNARGPWAPCAPFITGNLYDVEARHAWTTEQFAAAFADMALGPAHWLPRVWLNSVRDGWVAYLASTLVPACVMDRVLQLKYNLGAHLFPRASPPPAPHPSSSSSWGLLLGSGAGAGSVAAVVAGGADAEALVAVKPPQQQQQHQTKQRVLVSARAA